MLKDFLFFFNNKIKNNVTFIKNFFASILSIFIISQSGYFLVVNELSSRYKIIILVMFVALLFLLFLSTHNIKEIFADLKRKKFFIPSFTFLFSCLIIVWCVVSFIFCASKSLNIYSYLNFIILISASYVTVSSISFNEFKKWYLYCLILISIVTLLFYSYTQISIIPFATSYNLDGSSIVEQYSIFFSDFSSILSSLSPIKVFYTPSSTRLSGIFWEPGVYATILSIGLIFETFFNKKPRFLVVILFIISILLTQSTAGYIILPFILLLYLFKSFKFEKRKKFYYSIIIIFCILLLAVIILFFGQKIIDGSLSFKTRLLSTVYYFKVSLSNIFFGVGPVTAYNNYFDLISASSDVVDAGTSTIGYLVASFGLIGYVIILVPILGIFGTKKMNIAEKITLLIIFCFILLKENQVAIFISFVCMFYLISNLKFKKSLLYKQSFKESIIFKTFFARDNELISNIGYSFIVKSVALIVGLVTIPIYGTYFGNDASYGVWLTIISILSWVLIFDFGFSNGLRTKLPSSLVSKDYDVSRQYLSSSYTVSSTIGILIGLVGCILGFVLDWQTLFNVDSSIVSNTVLSFTMSIVFITVGLQFSLRVITSILDSIGKSALAGSLALISNIALLLYAMFGHYFSFGDKFISLSIVYLFCITLPLVIATLFVFKKTEISKCKPVLFAKDSIRTSKSLIKMNIVFFAIQLSDLFLISINSFIIIQLFGPNEVTYYTEYYKLFSFIPILFTSIFQAPIWVAVAKATNKKNVKEINKLSKTTTYLGILFSIISACIFLALPLLFEIWLGEDQPPFSYLIALVFFIDSIVKIMTASSTIISNGLSNIKPQAIVYVIAAILKIPLVLLLNLFLSTFLSFSIVILANFLITWCLLIILPISNKRRIKKINKLPKIYEGVYNLEV